jgi:hypothetical protein
MATSAQIKSAIRSRGASQRDITEQLAGVTEQLQRAEESANLFRLREAEQGRTLAFLSSGLELAATRSEQIKQSAELDRNIKAFEDSLPEGIRKEYRIDKADISLMDVFKRKNTLTDFLSQEDKYFLGEKQLGSKYDVAARGKEIMSKSLVKNLLESMDSPSMMDTSTKFPSTLTEPKLDFNLQKLYGSTGFMMVNKDNNINQIIRDISDSGFISDEEAERRGFG